jgi:RHS Repeat
MLGSLFAARSTQTLSRFESLFAMKRILLFLGIILTATSVASAQEPTLTGTEQPFSRSYSGLVGPVRTLLSVSKRPEGPIARTFATTTCTFDPTGAITDTLYHSADIEIHSGKLVSLDFSQSFIYDANKRLIRAVRSDPDGTLTGKDEYHYDATGRLTETIQYSRDGTITEKSLFAYEPSKRQTTVTWLEFRGKPLTLYFVYTFDGSGRAIERTTLNADHSLNHRIVYAYDSKSNLSKEDHYNEANVYRWGQIYTYKLDANGNWFERENMYTQSDREPSLDMVTYRVITYYGHNR